MTELLDVNVSEHTEKKGGLTYLSWAWAWAAVLRHDPLATWVVHIYGPEGSQQPCMWIGETAMVHTTVTIKGTRRDCMLPVMDNRNNAVKNPDARKISDAIMRCMTKAVAMHGLGLYIYAGEDLPQSVEEVAQTVKPGVMAAVLHDSPALPEEEATYIKELAVEVSAIFGAKGASTAYERVILEGLDSDQSMYLWSQLASNVRSGLKAEKAKRVTMAAA